MYSNDEYWNVPPKPYWFKNLEKAWESNRKAGAAKRAKESDAFFERFGSPEEMLRNPEPYLAYCREREPTRPVGRPKLPPEEKKHPKIKRSEQMRQLLKENGINVLDELSLDKYPDWSFQPNGRVKQSDKPPISVHLFLKNLNAK